MKRILTLISFVALSFSAFSQLGKGSILLGGDLVFDTRKSEQEIAPFNEATRNYLLVQPTVGIAIRENFFVGATLRYGRSRDENKTSGYENTDEQVGAGVFLRKYQPLGKSGFFVFGQAGLNVDTRRIETIGVPAINDSRQRSHSIAIYVQPGISYEVSRRFQLETGLSNLAALSFYSDKTKTRSNSSSPYTDSNKSSGLSFSSSLSNTGNPFYFGFRVLLRK